MWSAPGTALVPPLISMVTLSKPLTLSGPPSPHSHNGTTVPTSYVEITAQHPQHLTHCKHIGSVGYFCLQSVLWTHLKASLLRGLPWCLHMYQVSLASHSPLLRLLLPYTVTIGHHVCILYHLDSSVLVFLASAVSGILTGIQQVLS